MILNLTVIIIFRPVVVWWKYSPAYADIYMAEWERPAFAKCTKFPVLHLCYLDDIFGVWADTEASLIEFVAVLNSHHPQ